MNQPWVYMCPPIPETPTRLPPHPIPLACPRAPALSALFMQQFSLVIYFIYSNIHVSILFSKHPTLIFSHRVQKSVLYIYVSFAVLHIGSSPSFQIPYICVNILYWCFCFWFTSLCIISSSFIHCIRTEFKCVLFYSWIIFHYVYVPLLPYPFMCWWASRLLPCPSYCKQCCNEHWGTCVYFSSGFLSEYAQQWDCWVLWQFYFQFFKESPHCSP